MDKIVNGAVLEKLFAYSRELGKGGATEDTAERFLAAVCDFADGGFTVPEAEEGHPERLRMILNDSGISIPDFRAVLLRRIRRTASAELWEKIYLRQLLRQAKEMATDRQRSELFPEDLLRSILAQPSDRIRQCIRDAQKPSDGTEDAPEEVPEEKPEEKFDRLFRAEEMRTEGDGEDAVPASADTVAALTERIRQLRDRLRGVVYGQDHAINAFSTGYFQAEMRLAMDRESERPSATFLFAGPPGVGKTFLAETAAQMLGLAFLRLDMSEYADSNSYMDLIGYGENYKTPGEGILTGFVRKHRKCVLLFDEIEKASVSTIHLFLQILDAGRLTDNRLKKEVSFRETVIFFTTNAGRALYEASDAGDLSGLSRKVILKALQGEINPYTRQPYFPAAICSRFATGNVVLFNPMSADCLYRIVKREADRFADRFEKQYGVSVTVSDEVCAALLFREGGAADARMVRSRAERFFADEIFEISRLAAARGQAEEFSRLKKIVFDVRTPEDPDAAAVFADRDAHNVLLFSPGEDAGRYDGICPDIRFLSAGSVDAAEKLLRGNRICLAVLELCAPERSADAFLNIEDIDSCTRDALLDLRKHHPEIPVYIALHKDGDLNAEEKTSFTGQGVRGFTEIGGTPETFVREVGGICRELYRQSSMKMLARSNRLLTFETGQLVGSDGETGRVVLFDFKLTTAIEGEDAGNILSSLSMPDVRFDQIIGAESAKEELRFFIDYLKDPKAFEGTGLRAPRGVLLYGPPGTGKTLLAKATACEAGVTFLSAEGNQFIQKYLGEGKEMLHRLFATARKYSPAILFIDEFESIAKERQGGDHAAANGEDVLTALLTEMDGFRTDITKPVFVLAATNFDVTPGSGRSLDPAALRRFDSRIYVDLPDNAERLRFIRMRTGENPAFSISDTEAGNLAARSVGMSLADLESVLELSLRRAIRGAERKVTDRILDDAFETQVGGEAKRTQAPQLERTARHEAGHAYLCWRSGAAPSYVSVVARGDRGGYAQPYIDEEKGVYTKAELLARICAALGGRAAEIVYYGAEDGITTGASGDLAYATDLARQILCRFGMDESFGPAVADGAEAHSAEVRAAVNALLREQLHAAIGQITEGRAAVDALTQALLSKNHLSGGEIDRILSEASSR